MNIGIMGAGHVISFGLRQRTLCFDLPVGTGGQ